MVGKLSTCLLAALGAVGFSYAAAIPVRVIGVTPTQAVFAYNAPDSNSCSVIAADGNGNTVHDTDTTLFPGADNDLRPGNLATGTSRTVVIGKRTSDLGSDGKMYSRALQADSQYQLQVNCRGGASTGQVGFRTQTIALGNSAPDPFPFNSNGYGNYAYPTVDMSNTAKSYVDPQTGALLKMVTQPGYGSPGITAARQPMYVYDLAGTWNNPQTILSQDGQYASYSGAGGASNALFVPTPTSEGQRGYIYVNSNYLDDLLARLNGYGDQANSADRTVQVCLTADAGQTCKGNAISIVLPQGAAAEVTGPASFPQAMFSGWGSPIFTADSFVADYAGSGRSVSVANKVVTNTTPLLFGAQLAFPLSLPSGTHIHIAGSAPTCPNNDCTITQAIDGTHLQIQQDLGSSFSGAQTTLSSALTPGATTVNVADSSGFIRNYNGGLIYALTIESDSVQCTGVSGNTFSGCSGVGQAHASGVSVTTQSFVLTNFGFKLWKATPVGSVYIDSAKYDYASSSDYFLGYEGEGLVCSGNVTASYAADGVTPLAQPINGKTCIISSTWGEPFLFFFDPASGELRTIARLSSSGVAQDTSDPLRFFQYDANAHNIITCSYDAANGKFRSIPVNYDPSNNPYFSCGRNLTAGPGNDVVSQIKSRYPQIDMNYWAMPQFSNVLGGIATFQMRPTQNAMAWVCYFDVNQPAGQQLSYCGDTWSHYPLRWAGMHGGWGNRTADGWLTYATMGVVNSPGQTAIERYTMQIKAIYNNAGSTALSSTTFDASTCEQLGVSDSRWIAEGATGRNCIKINVSTEPVSTNPSQADLVTGVPAGSRPMAWAHNATSCGGDGTTTNCWSYLQPIAEGDWVRDLGDAGGDYGAERFLIAKKSTLADGSIDLVLSRAVSTAPVPLCVGNRADHAAGFTLLVDVPFGCAGNEYWTNGHDSNRTIYADNPVPYGAHTELEYDPAAGAFTQWTPYNYALGGNVPGQYGFGYGVRSGKLPSFFGAQFMYGLEMAYTFNGTMTGTDRIQTHPGASIDYDALGNRLIYGIDARPLGGPGGGDPLAWYHSLSLVSGTQHVYKISLPLDGPSGSPLQNTALDRKRRAMVGWYGHTLLRDISGPGSQISDGTTDSFCVADFAGECVAGSSKGDQFVSVANADTSGQCIIWYIKKTPCLAVLANEAARYVQFDVSKPDPTGARWRVLSSLWGGPGRTDNYANVHGTDGAGWVFGVGKWANGDRSQIYGIKVPSWRLDSQYRGDFEQIPIKVSGRSGDTVRVRFGYDTNLFCTTRQEQCSTGATNGDAFAWASEQPSWQACTNQCSVTVPGIAGRVLYYVVDRKDSTGVISSGLTQVVAVN
jgi:hypothetical protein